MLYWIKAVALILIGRILMIVYVLKCLKLKL